MLGFIAPPSWLVLDDGGFETGAHIAAWNLFLRVPHSTSSPTECAENLNQPTLAQIRQKLVKEYIMPALRNFFAVEIFQRIREGSRCGSDFCYGPSRGTTYDCSWAAPESWRELGWPEWQLPVQLGLCRPESDNLRKCSEPADKLGLPGPGRPECLWANYR